MMRKNSEEKYKDKEIMIWNGLHEKKPVHCLYVDWQQYLETRLGQVAA